jgi:gliding motility-associated-like protein
MHKMIQRTLFILLTFLFDFSSIKAQVIKINSIANARMPAGDNGYTFDGMQMNNTSRLKLLEPLNFGPLGTYPKTVQINDAFGSTESLRDVTKLPFNELFFFGGFNKLDGSYQAFSQAEIDSLYSWSLKGGKVIIAGGGRLLPNFDGNVLDEKWGFKYQVNYPCDIVPTIEGNNTTIFNGPFGNVPLAKQGGGAQGYFKNLTSNAVYFSSNWNSDVTMFMDCNTLDLIVADVDAYTRLSGISIGPSISLDQERFLANTIVFMDQLQDPPLIKDNQNELAVQTNFNSYLWYYNNSPVADAITPNYEANNPGEYYVEVTVNGGCKVKSDVFIVDSIFETDTLLLPNLFSPNGDGVNDFFNPIENKGYVINHIAIYNRWGNLVHQAEVPKILWDGKFEKATVPAGVYYWVMQYEHMKETKIKKGFLTLMK